jgi:tripartite-type tricarboxylate transporter receptor subunit TctC
MRFMTIVVGTSCLLLMALFIVLFAIAHEAAADEYYKGKTVSVYVGYGPGGTNDIVTRLVAAHIGPHMGGNPTVVVRNMPGAASRKLAAYIFTRAAKDGTEFGNIDRAVSTESLLDPTAKNPFDVLGFTWVGSPTQETLVCVSWHTSKVQSVEDILTKDYVVASPGSSSGEQMIANALDALLGAKVRAIGGYPGGSEMNLAMERGEVDGRCGMGWGAIKVTSMDQIKSKQLKVLLQTSIDKHPDLPDVPNAYDMVKSEADRQPLALLFASQKVGRPFIAPPNMPEDREAALRKAFDDTMHDPAFIAGAEKLKFDLQPISGAEIERILKAAYATPAPVIARTVKIVQGK